MADIRPVLNEFVSGHEVFLLTWGPAFVLLVLALMVVWPLLLSRYMRWRLLRQVKALGTDSLHDSVIPDGMDGQIYIENMVLRAEGILVLPIKHYSGVLFAADNIDHWTSLSASAVTNFPIPCRNLRPA
jgi:hypothetical protein